MPGPVTPERVAAGYRKAAGALLAERTPSGWWVGRLSTSALSTATAVTALEMVRRRRGDSPQFGALIAGGLDWLAAHQNADGGWGDTTKSFSNISTTMLAHAAFHATGTTERFAGVVERAAASIEKAGGVPAVVARYGKDKTFSVPILTHCALAGLVDWSEIPPLPFEMACLPPRFYKTVRLPVVSYALPALIAIGQVRHHFRKPGNPLARLMRRFSIEPSLKILEHIQPENGGFLEAAPLTSFVTMSLAAMGRADHAVARRGTQFLIDSVLPDGSWPIDTNLATWVTTLSVNALGDDLPESAREPIREWLLAQQYHEVHPYTQADPGGWAWSDLPGAVPDADDTPGAILALLNLTSSTDAPPVRERVARATHNGMRWLLDLQNRDGGWPTFCRGWGALPFDRSGADLTAHAIRAGLAWSRSDLCSQSDPLRKRLPRAMQRGFRYLSRQQRADGSWLPLWFGNQHCHDDENGVYGTSRVLAAYRDAGRLDASEARRGLQFLTEAQHADGGWGGMPGAPPSIEETALAAEIMLAADPHSDQSCAALAWLLERIEADEFTEPSPIGFYFAKLWYFETTYPLSFIVGALRRAAQSAPAEKDRGFTAQEQTARVRLRAE